MDVADGEKDRGIERLALRRIARRYASVDTSRLAAYLEGVIVGESQIIEALIVAIQKAEAEGLSRYALSQRTGIPQSTLSRLLNRERDSLRIETVERLCTELGFVLEMRPARPRRSTRTPTPRH